MQQLLAKPFNSIWYFAFGCPEKTSFCTEYCREHHMTWLNNPSVKHLKQKCDEDFIIQGSVELFRQVQLFHSSLNVIMFIPDQGALTPQEKQIRRQYRQLGRCYDIRQLNYNLLRKQLYPKLIFFYGPKEKQNYAASVTLSKTIGYEYSQLPLNPNDIINCFDKTNNYVINGLFTKIPQLKIIEQHFNIKIIHFKYERDDLPKYQTYFDTEYDLLPFLKQKQYYVPVKGDDHPNVIMDNVGVGTCPRMLYIHYGGNQGMKKYVEDYIEQTDGIMLNMNEIIELGKKKHLPDLPDVEQRAFKLTRIFYRNFNMKEYLLCGFPYQTQQFIGLQNINRKFSAYIDLSKPQKHEYTSKLTSQIYYLQNQLRITPNPQLPLSQQLRNTNQYWIISGPGTSGKTTVAKYLASEFGFKYIDYEAECAVIKQKIASPEDGDQVPVKKYIDYFAKLVKQNSNTTYVFDTIPYQKGDLQNWIKTVGTPDIINLKIQADQQIKRTRKKAEGDVNAQVSEEQSAKAAQLIQKNNQWIQSLGELSPCSKIYQLDYKMPQLLAQPLINSILRPRVFLIQNNNNLTYQNIAIRHQMGFINLNKVKLRQSIQLVRRCGKRDVIVCGYAQEDKQSLVSDDLYWIEKNLGEIRYLGIWEPEEKQIKQKMMELERPPQEQKPKKPEGQQGQQEPPEQAQEGQQGVKKKVLDIYEYQWSEPKTHKNLSQWFFKLKKNIHQRTNQSQGCYQKFREVLDIINKSNQNNIYEVIK